MGKKNTIIIILFFQYKIKGNNGFYCTIIQRLQKIFYVLKKRQNFTTKKTITDIRKNIRYKT